MANWSDLPHDLVVCIAQKMETMKEFITFGAVCKTWSSAATKENFTTRALTHQVPMLMLPLDGIAGQCYNLLKGKDVSRLNIPKTIIQRQLPPFAMSSLGWLITKLYETSRHHYLLHPFKQEEILLPAVSFDLRLLFVRKFVLSSSPSMTSDYIVMVSFGSHELAFWRPKDNEWTKISSNLGGWETDNTRSYDIAYYKGQFYMVDADHRVLVFDIEDPKKATAKVVVSDTPTPLVSRDNTNQVIDQLYLVESLGALLLVFRLKNTDKNGFRVFEVPLSTGNWMDAKEVNNLGNRALFLSVYSSSISIEVSDSSGCKANCIYFARYRLMPGFGHFGQNHIDDEVTQVSVFSMEDKKVEQIFISKPYNSRQSYLWIQRTF